MDWMRQSDWEEVGLDNRELMGHTKVGWLFDCFIATLYFRFLGCEVCVPAVYSRRVSRLKDSPPAPDASCLPTQHHIVHRSYHSSAPNSTLPEPCAASGSTDAHDT